VIPSKAEWMQVPPTAKMRLTPEGERSAIMRLEDDAGQNQSLWSLVSPMLDLPRLEGPKTGATVLATLTLPQQGGTEQSALYPLVAWQRYGTGKSMYIGTDQLWRLRFKRGGKYHAKFWNQAIQVLTFSRLLGENKRICIESDQKEYPLGARVLLTVNAHNEMFEPLKAPQFVLDVQEQGRDTKTGTATLQALTGSPGLYQGYYSPSSAGVVSFSAQGVASSDTNTVKVSVRDKPLEMQEPELQLALLQQMALQSGGRYFSIRELPALPGWLEGQEPTEPVRSEKRVVLPFFLLIILCAGVEWFLRRKNDLC
jgi:hypothetical protein